MSALIYYLKIYCQCHQQEYFVYKYTNEHGSDGNKKTLINIFEKLDFDWIQPTIKEISKTLNKETPRKFKKYQIL